MTGGLLHAAMGAWWGFYKGSRLVYKVLMLFMVYMREPRSNLSARGRAARARADAIKMADAARRTLDAGRGSGRRECDETSSAQ